MRTCCNKNTPLHIAAQLGNTDIAKILISKGAIVDKEDDYFNRTPLHYASLSGRLEMVKLLIENGAKLEVYDKYRWSPLHCAAWGASKECEKIAAFFINKGLKKDVFILAGLGYKEELKRILDNNRGIINSSDKSSRTMLHWAAFRNRFDTCKMLVEKNCNIDPLEIYKNTPLCLAVNQGHTKLCEFLIDSGANIHHTNSLGWRPVHWAAAFDKVDILKFLLSKGASFDVEDKTGKTPFDLAAERKRLETVNFFRSLHK